MRTMIFAIVLIFSAPVWAGPFSPLTSDQVPQGTPPAITQPNVESGDLFRGKSVAILASHGVEESEITFPYTYLINRGAQVDILVPSWTPQGVVASRFLSPSLFVQASGTFHDGLAKHYDLIVLTGGAWNAQVVRSDLDALALVRSQFASHRPIAAICAGTIVLENAGLTRGLVMTGSPLVKLDLVNSGAIYQDSAVVVTELIVTSRTPDDLPEFVSGLREVLLSH